VLDYAKQRNLAPQIESRMSYITTLYNEEFHLIARPEVKSISDLANQKVSVDVNGAGTSVSMPWYRQSGCVLASGRRQPAASIALCSRRRRFAVARDGQKRDPGCETPGIWPMSVERVSLDPNAESSNAWRRCTSASKRKRRSWRSIRRRPIKMYVICNKEIRPMREMAGDLSRERVECVVVGAGVVGLAAARALALAGYEVLVLERASTIGFETSSRNSEVIHGGLYYPPDSLKARSCVAGRQAFTPTAASTAFRMPA
jgi:hypothetical protein